MKRIIKYLLIVIYLTSFTVINFNYNQAEAAVSAPVKPAVSSAVQYLSVSPVDVVNCPDKYLNKHITFNAEFVTFTSLGLDYKPAMRDSAKYIGMLIKRDDVKDHVIPLSEMKLFLSREIAEKHIDLEAGDKVKISGTVFSTALGDPWVDIKVFDVLTKKEKTTEKK